MDEKSRRGIRAHRDQLLTLVNGWDPVGRLEAGAPRDAYESVVDDLLAFLAEDRDKEDVAAFLDRKITDRFGAKPKDVLPFANRAVTWFRIASEEQ